MYMMYKKASDRLRMDGARPWWAVSPSAIPMGRRLKVSLFEIVGPPANRATLRDQSGRSLSLPLALVKNLKLGDEFSFQYDRAPGSPILHKAQDGTWILTGEDGEIIETSSRSYDLIPKLKFNYTIL